jgi:4-hydroxy-2-oxoheptanedioate aldolase
MGKSIVCMLLIETRAAIENIEVICNVDGVDCMVIAPFDLSTELGVPGRLDAPEFREAVGHLESVILQAGIPLGGAALTHDQTRDLLKRGYRVLVHGFDVLMLAGLVRQAAACEKIRNWHVAKPRDRPLPARAHDRMDQGQEPGRASGGRG